MKRLFVQILLLSIFILAGCEEANNNYSVTNNSDTNKVSLSNKADFSPDNQNNSNETQKENIKISEIDAAQKDYQDSYNEYVRCLREIGPQKIETLKALSNYQKKYHIYQKLLKEESEK